MRKARGRLDRLLVEKGLAESREKAKAIILAGRVLVDGKPVDKAGKVVDSEAEIRVIEPFPYVSRGGLKLEGALKAFAIDVEGKRIMDIGASTGGFTDCLLRHGAERVYAVDVGYGLLDWRLRRDERVVVLERRNIRHLDPQEVGEKMDLITIDVSFISLEKVIPKAVEFLKEGGIILALIKPQFEVGKGEVGKGGVVRDRDKQMKVVERLKGFSRSLGLKVKGVVESPIRGTKGNREFWLYLEG